MILIHYSKNQHKNKKKKEKQSSETNKTKKSRLYSIIARFLLHG